jgi:hypothetical protein
VAPVHAEARDALAGSIEAASSAPPEKSTRRLENIPDSGKHPVFRSTPQNGL